MRQATLIFTALVLTAMSTPGIAARVVSKPILHREALIYEAYCGKSCDAPGNKVFQGSASGVGDDVIKAVPGVLAINPGGTQPLKGWPNYVSASLPSGPSNQTWSVTNLTLRKAVPPYLCTVNIGGTSFLRQGSANVRLWWPLMYELPGTAWTLTITYKTSVWDDDGPGTNLPATTHQDVWQWRVDATLESMESVVKLFHELPAGTCGAPLINGETIYSDLLGSLERLQKYTDRTDPQFIEDFYSLIMLLEDCCLTADCGSCETAVGIRNTNENPACCKLLADADYILEKLQLARP